MARFRNFRNRMVFLMFPAFLAFTMFAVAANGDLSSSKPNTAAPSLKSAPRVTKTLPPAYANNVNPAAKFIAVMFDQEMADNSWSWTGGGDTFPEIIGQPQYLPDKKTCRINVKLQPGKVYQVGINSPSAQNFKSVSDVPAIPYVILFATKDAQGKPTPIPADLLSKIRQENCVSKVNALPWTRPGAEALTVYQEMVQDKIETASIWRKLGIKLIDSSYYQEALDCFVRCEKASSSGSIDKFVSMVWQGHLYDLLNQRDKAVEKYSETQKMNFQGTMRHDQWGITLSNDWVKKRLEAPFTKDLLQPDPMYETSMKLGSIPWTNPGEQILTVYHEMTQNKSIRSKDSAARVWFILGIKLTGGAYYKEAMDCFSRCEAVGDEGYKFFALVWQGHLYDLAGQRDKAMKKYSAALQANPQEKYKMTHDQWGIAISNDWVKKRLETPFTEDMLRPKGNILK